MRRHYKGISINTSKYTHETIFGLIGTNKNSQIADIPSGAGAFILRLKDNGYSNVFAIDIEDILEIDHDNFLKGDMTAKLPLEDETLDLAVCIDGIEHIDEQFKFIEEISRTLKSGGECIISTPNISSLRSRWKWMMTGHHHKCNSPLDENNPSPLHHIAMISLPEIRYLLHTNGLYITKVTTNRIKPVSWIYSLLLPFVYIATSWVYFKTGKKEKKPINKAVKKAMFSIPVLYGETLIVKAKKK